MGLPTLTFYSLFAQLTDTPNDLLRELDEMAFFIPELDETVTAKKRPIVLITSNAEKELPDAFLRRCLFHYIAFIYWFNILFQCLGSLS